MRRSPVRIFTTYCAFARREFGEAVLQKFRLVQSGRALCADRRKARCDSTSENGSGDGSAFERFERGLAGVAVAARDATEFRLAQFCSRR